MDALEAILTRRSIRRYTAEPVAEDLIKKLLEAAMYAPSAHNQQPWQFIVIQDRQVLDKIPEGVVPFSLIAVGYPAEEKLRPDRFDEQRIHYNRW